MSNKTRVKKVWFYIMQFFMVEGLGRIKKIIQECKDDDQPLGFLISEKVSVVTNSGLNCSFSLLANKPGCEP